MSEPMPKSMRENSYQQLIDLQTTTREMLGALHDRLRPVLIQRPEAIPDKIHEPNLSGLADRVAAQQEILDMLNQLLRDLDL